MFLADSGKNPLYVACEHSCEDSIARLLQHGADPNVLCCKNHCNQMHSSECATETVLHLVCSVNSDKNAQIVGLLLKHGANVNAVCSKGETALYRACRNRQVEVVQLMLAAGADVNITTSQSYPLIAACTVDRYTVKLDDLVALMAVTTENDIKRMQMSAFDVAAASVVKLLLKSGADVNAQCPAGNTALVVATRSGLTETLRLLLEYSSSSSELSTKQALYIACRLGYADILDLLLMHSTHSNLASEINKLLAFAVDKCFIDCAQFLVMHGADVNRIVVSGTPALHYTVKQLSCWSDVEPEDRLRMLMVLLEAEATNVQAVDDSGKSALHYALEAVSSPDCNREMCAVNMLLACGADVSRTTSYDGETPLYIACSKNLTSLVSEMLKHNAKLNVIVGQKSPLNIACKNKNRAIIELLLYEGADPNVPEHRKNCTSFALHIAAADNNHELVRLLLNYEADVNAVDTSGNTALLHLLSNNAPSNHAFLHNTMNTLLNAGADVNVINNCGETALYIAVENGLVVFLEDILSYGGNPNVHDGNKLPLSVACMEENLAQVQMLLKAGADPNKTCGKTEREIDKRHDLPLSIATKNCNQELSKMLLCCGANVNMLNSEGKSALHLAIESMSGNGHSLKFSSLNTADKTDGLPVMIELLLEYGADINQPMPDGQSPLSLLINYTQSLVPSHWFQMRQYFENAIRVFVSKGASLSDSTSNVGNDFLPGQVKILQLLCGHTDHFVIDLLKAGAGFKLLAYCCVQKSTVIGFQQAKSIRICQAAVLAGCVPSAEELEEIQQSVVDEHAVTTVNQPNSSAFFELLSWLTKDRQQAPSLMRQCRVAIRRQLSFVSGHRSILPAIAQLPGLPSELQEYLLFEGCLAELSLDI